MARMRLPLPLLLINSENPDEVHTTVGITLQDMHVAMPISKTSPWRPFGLKKPSTPSIKQCHWFKAMINERIHCSKAHGSVIAPRARRLVVCAERAHFGDWLLIEFTAL